MSDIQTEAMQVNESNNQETQVIDYSEMETVLLRDVFHPFVPANVDLAIERPKHIHPDVPKPVHGYVPDMRVLKNVMTWFLAPSHPNFLHMVGPTGSGKTDFIFWFANRMNWALNLVTVNPSLRPEKMQGRWLLKNGETTFVDGPVIDAMREGKIVLLDECDKGSLDFIAKMHLPSEMSKLWVVEDTGETIYPAKNFRFITTGNTSGQGCTQGLYPSSKRWDTAFRNRSYVIFNHYVDPELELKIIMGKNPELKPYKKTVKYMVKFANSMRDSMLGPERTGVTSDGRPVNGISTAFSTRVLLSWVHFIQVSGLSVPLRQTFENVFFNGVDDADRKDIEMIMDQNFNLKDGNILDHYMGWIEDGKPVKKQ